MKTVAKRVRKSKAEREQEALERGSRMLPNGNDGLAVLEFRARGIPMDEIETFGPSQNVRTYHAWRALGRQVRKGEKSVRVPVWIPDDEPERDPVTGKLKPGRCRLVTACVFHVSQTDAANGKGGAS